MASSIIHMCVANEINKKLKRDYKNILIGTIAPDISKQIGENKVKSHFLIDNTDVPDLDKFINKYKYNFDDDFVLGYYIHLYTDYLWFKYFITSFIDEKNLYRIDGKKEKVESINVIEYIYNDYTNLNIKLIDKYNLNLKIFYDEIPKFKNIIEEIPMEKINVIVEKAGLIIKNSKTLKPYIFDIRHIEKFITMCTDIILKDLERFKI